MVSRRFLLGATAQLAAVASLAVACAPAGTTPSAPAGATTPQSPGEQQAGAQPVPPATLQPVELAFCSQVMCVLPFEVARQRGLFEAEGLAVNLVYMKGGTQAINALVAGSVDWVGTPVDLVVKTVANGKDALMIASTSQLPFFALAVGPQARSVQSVGDLAGKKVGVGNLGTTDHLMAQYLLVKSGVSLESVEFVAAGPNLYDQLVRGQVEAGMVQEPSLTLVERAGGRVLVNFMKLSDTQKFLGGPYQFMGLNTRREVLQDPRKVETAQKLIRGLVRANRWIRDNPGSAIVKAIPAELVAGGDLEVFAASLDQYKRDLYPADARLVEDSIARVIDVQQQSGALEAGKSVQPGQVYTNQYVPEV